MTRRGRKAGVSGEFRQGRGHRVTVIIYVTFVCGTHSLSLPDPRSQGQGFLSFVNEGSKICVGLLLGFLDSR